MRLPSFLLVLISASAPVSAQGAVIDVGLTVTAGSTTMFGQVCGPVTCRPVPAAAARGQLLTIVHYSAPITPFALAFGLRGPCRPVPGLGNPLLLGLPTTLGVGITSHPPTIRTICDQGLAVHVLRVPLSVPPGMVFRLQSLGISNSGPLDLGPAIEVTIR